MWVNGVEKQVRPSGWTPWANTIAYYPLTSSSTNKDIVNNRNLTTFWWVTYETLSSWLSVARLSGVSSSNSNQLITDSHTWYNIGTISVWGKPENNGWSYVNKYILARVWNQEYLDLFTAWNGVYNARSKVSSSSSRIYTSNISPIVDNKWHHFVASSSVNSIALYIDWVLIWQTNTTANELSTNAYLYIWSNDDSYYGYKWLMSNVIIENKARTAQEISDYYNQTKANYWL
jgi:hypothetical protein